MLRRLLLIQIRDPGDPMARHERACVARRVEGRGLDIAARNALEEPASDWWLEGVDGIIIGGSGDHSVHHPASASWVTPLRRLLDTALEDGLPGFGLCFGHQLLGMHLGARILTDAARTEIGTVEVDLTDEGRSDRIFGALPPRFSASTGHSDYVVDRPAGVRVLASTPLVDHQAFHLEGTGWYSTQFHPDLMASEAKHRYLAYAGAFATMSPEDMQRRRAKAERFTEGRDDAASLLGRWLDALSERTEVGEDET